MASEQLSDDRDAGAGRPRTDLDEPSAGLAPSVSKTALDTTLRAALNDVGDGTDADLNAPAFRLTGDRRKSPSGLLAVMRWLVTDGANASTDDWMAAGTLLDYCVDGDCFSDPVEGHAFDEAIRLARALILSRSDQRSELSSRRKLAARTLDPTGHRLRLRAAALARPATPILARAGLGRWAGAVTAGPRLAAVRGSDFQSAGKALTEGEVRGRVLLYVDAITRTIRPSISDAAIRLLARSGYDVDVPPAASDSGAIPDQLGLPDLARQQITDNCRVWTKSLRRSHNDDRPEPISAIITLSPLAARTINHYPTRVPVAADDDVLRPALERARDIIDWLADNEIDPPRRWSAFRTGLVGGGGQTPDPVAMRSERAIAGLQQSGFGVRRLGSGPSLGRGVGILPWVAPELNADLRAFYTSLLDRARIDVLAVDEAASIGVLADLTTAPVVHVVELLDWVRGGPVPEGCEQIEALMHDLPTPADAIAADPAPNAEADI